MRNSIRELGTKKSWEEMAQSLKFQKGHNFLTKKLSLPIKVWIRKREREGEREDREKRGKETFFRDRKT